MSEASGEAANLPDFGREPYTAVTGSRRRTEKQARVTNPQPRMLERVGSFVGSVGSALAIIGFALPIGSGWYQVDGYGVFLLLVLRGNWALTYPAGGLGWALVPLVFWLLVAVLAGPITLSLMAERATQRFPRLSLGVFVVGCLLIWYVVGATFCLAAPLTSPVALAALALLSLRNPARSHPWVYALAPLVGMLAYGGGMALYVANGVHWSLGNAASAEGLTNANNVGIGFWLCAAGWLLATLGGTLLWRACRQAGSR